MRKEQSAMSKNTDRPAFEPAEITVEGDTLKIKMNKDTEESAQKLSAYIRALNLTAEQNNELIAMIIEHVQDAERGAAGSRERGRRHGSRRERRAGQAGGRLAAMRTSGA